jgi:putative tryptophan/tyrosine transport system substrate-binding protein
MRRREFIQLVGGAAVAWPLAARAQQAGMPVIGFLRSTAANDTPQMIEAFRRGLRTTGYIDGQSVTIEVRGADNQYDRLPALAAGLVQRNVAVIVATGATSSPLAAKAATSAIPIVVVIGSDPVRNSLVASLNRPGGNVTGLTFDSGALLAKRVELLREIVLGARTIGMLVNPNNPNAEPESKELEALAHAHGWALQIVQASNEADLDSGVAMFSKLHVDAFFNSTDAFFSAHVERIVDLAKRYALPAIYTRREFTAAGGLMSYGTIPAEVYRQAGIYAGTILKGTKPAELPVQLPSKFEFVINLNTAKTLSLEVPTSLLLRADEVIE